LVQLGVLEIHPWGSRKDKLDRPDRLIFDLDPGPEVAWADVVDAAREMHARLLELGLESFVRTTGGKGLHVVAPLMRRSTWDDVKGFAKGIATQFVRQDSRRFIAVSTKSKRTGKIYIDYLRNDHSATAIASYSSRAREGAPVATPLRWDELSAELNPAQFNVNSVPRRLASLKADPWKGFTEVGQQITKTMRRAVGAI
jgi:bifunctional non-homologous end joining protein LigD